jgi:hypothetical protein
VRGVTGGAGAGDGVGVYAAVVIARLAVLPAARAWHAVTAVVVGAGLLAQSVLVVAGGQTTMPERILRPISYFTFQAEVLVLAWSAMQALRPERDSTVWRVVRLDTLIATVLTFVIYLLLLRPTLHLSGWDEAVHVCLHYLTPTLVVGGWLLFGPRQRIDLRAALLALAWPIGWFAWTLLHGALASFYPYPFVDVRSLGYSGVLLRAGVALVALFGLAVTAWTLDRRLNAVAPHGWAPPWQRTDDGTRAPRLTVR